MNYKDRQVCGDDIKIITYALAFRIGSFLIEGISWICHNPTYGWPPVRS